MVWPAETASQPGVVLDPCSQFQVQLSESFGVWSSGIAVPQTQRDGALTSQPRMRAVRIRIDRSERGLRNSLVAQKGQERDCARSTTPKALPKSDPLVCGAFC